MSAFRLALALSVLLLAAAPGAAVAGDCRTETFRDASFILCSFDPSKDDIRMLWRDRAGRPFRTFNALAGALESEGRSLRFAMNGGMYEEDLSPVGLYIENEKVLSKANTKTVRGRPSQIPNFYKKPNGVFYLGRGGAGSSPPRNFWPASRARASPRSRARCS